MELGIQYCSDLHLEFPRNKAFWDAKPLIPKANILVLAGDIVPFAVMDRYNDFFNFLSDHFEKTYWVPGNHEYYHYDIIKKSGSFRESVRENVFLVNNVCEHLGKFRLLLSTLWTHIRPAYGWQIERSMNDFRQIKNNGFRLTSDKYNQLHEEALEFLKKELRMPSATDDIVRTQNIDSGIRTIVCTHHAPTFMHYPEQYRGDILNEAFAVELHDYIENWNIDFWMYGHHHTNTPTFQIGKTKLITNQLGYVDAHEHHTFNREAVI